ncbi:NADH dehydrogenase [ubiquinone] 1 beta subcomplex subunit 2, mitochondrial [Emydura macquarii macquarii]|uniref:NADH dehydrogenase [ubiquinone] 1 beta subcomplex subunit 2, mitochondrial n=1 Tax=Emydura macquarii macquarii TaxID=1129001 RepID=UPI00352AB2CF
MLRSVVGRAGGGLVRILRGRDGRGAAGLRHAGGGAHAYRQAPTLSGWPVIRGELLSSFMWFWILWNFWHSSEAVLGHFPYPDPSEWTDEELGIPPDDME